MARLAQPVLDVTESEPDRMRLAIFLLLLAIPLVELALLIKLGQSIGVIPTVGIVVATALFGAVILHRQGIHALRRAVEISERGAAPLEPAIDGVFLLLAGVLLLTPGLITDFIGVVLIIPPIRRRIAQTAFTALMRRATVEVHTSRVNRRRAESARHPFDEQRQGNDGSVIEGEFTRIDERTDRSSKTADQSRGSSER